MRTKLVVGGILAFLFRNYVPEFGPIPWFEIIGVGATLLILVIFLLWLQTKIRRDRVMKAAKKTQPVRPIIYAMPPSYVGPQTNQPTPPVWHNLPKEKYELL